MPQHYLQGCSRALAPPHYLACRSTALSCRRAISQAVTPHYRAAAQHLFAGRRPRSRAEALPRGPQHHALLPRHYLAVRSPALSYRRIYVWSSGLRSRAAGHARRPQPRALVPQHHLEGRSSSSCAAALSRGLHHHALVPTHVPAVRSTSLSCCRTGSLAAAHDRGPQHILVIAGRSSSSTAAALSRWLPHRALVPQHTLAGRSPALSYRSAHSLAATPRSLAAAYSCGPQHRAVVPQHYLAGRSPRSSVAASARGPQQRAETRT